MGKHHHGDLIKSCYSGLNLRILNFEPISPLLFLTYIHDLSNGLKANADLFANRTSLFTTAYDKNQNLLIEKCFLI